MDQESVMETATTAGAGAAIVSPWWLLPLLHDAIAGWLLPLMGVAWLAMQMYYKYKKESRSGS
jgi:hypothetical protein